MLVLRLHCSMGPEIWTLEVRRLKNSSGLVRMIDIVRSSLHFFWQRPCQIVEYRINQRILILHFLT